MKLLTLFLALLTVSGARTVPLYASEPQAERLRVFLDCPRGCEGWRSTPPSPQP